MEENTPEMCRQCENIGTGCVPNNAEAGQCAMYQKKGGEENNMIEPKEIKNNNLFEHHGLTCATCQYLPSIGEHCNRIGNEARLAKPHLSICDWYHNGKTGEMGPAEFKYQYKDGYTNCPYKDFPSEGVRRIYYTNPEIKGSESVNESTDIVNAEPEKVVPFDYSLLDSDTATFLQEKANRITEIRIKSVVAIGKELKEAHDKLANNKNGTFESWVESLGISHKTSRNYINAYEYILKNFQHIEDAEKIQPSLLFAVSKPSAPKELQEAVLSGDITTHKQYKELECKLKEVEHAKKIAESQLNNVNVIKQQLEEQNRRLANEKHMAENEIQRLTKQLEQAKLSGNAEEVKNLQIALKALEDEITKLKNDKESLQKQLKDKPIEVPAVKIVEKVPEKSKYEIINRTYGTLLAAKLISKSDIEICREADFTRKNSIIEFLENLRDAIPEYLNILNEEVQQHKCEDCRFCDWEDLKEEDEAAGMIYCTLNEDKQLWYNNRACENFEEL